ncbi:hypothetical protein [Nonomuraea sp. NPDC050783]|uniref:hypothetical protein n=1 Tax=Nonomuraea sp. NPDC050783 TaxID=3154634 RepID=UPI0034675A2D
MGHITQVTLPRTSPYNGEEVMHGRRLLSAKQVTKLVGSLLVILGMTAAFVTPANAAEAARPSREGHWYRCNDISGSPLCISIWGDLNENADVNVWYSKNAGPERLVQLYLSACGGQRDLVAQGTVEAGDTIDGSRVKYIYFNSCWVGHMRIGNTQYTTGEVTTR